MMTEQQEREIEKEIKAVKKEGLRIDQISLSLRYRFKDRQDVYVMYDNPFDESSVLNGAKENDLAIINDILSQVKGYYKYICIPYGTKNSQGDPHLISLILKQDQGIYKAIFNDSNTETSTATFLDLNQELISILKKFEIEEPENGCIFQDRSQEGNWECGVHAYLSTISVVENSSENNRELSEEELEKFAKGIIKSADLMQTKVAPPANIEPKGSSAKVTANIEKTQ